MGGLREDLIRVWIWMEKAKRFGSSEAAGRREIEL